MQDFVSTYLSDKYPMRHKRDLIFYGEEIPQINTSSRFYFPVIILRISLSLFRASSGVRLFTSRFLISSRTWLSTGSSNLNKLS